MPLKTSKTDGEEVARLVQKSHRTICAFVEPFHMAKSRSEEDLFNIAISALTYELIASARACGVSDENIIEGLKTCLIVTPRDL